MVKKSLTPGSKKVSAKKASKKNDQAEFPAFNEEPRPASGELETGKEEPHSVNGEPSSVNQKLKENIYETTRAYSDLQNLTASTDIATIFLDRQFRIKLLTPPVKELFNISPLDIGRPLEHFTNKLDYSHLNEDAAKVLRTRKPFEREIRDRENRTFLLCVLPYRTLDDRIEGVILNFIDITERKKAEKAIRESEERTRIAIEAAKLATWKWDFTSNLIYWNDRYFTLLGIKPSSKPVTPVSFFRRVHPGDRKRLNNELKKAVRENSVLDTEFCIIRKDGATRWMCGYGQVTEKSTDGAPLAMSGVIFDITERRETLEARRKSEEHLKLILESTKDYAIITFDLTGRITRWNAGAEKIFGYTEQEAVGQTTHLIFTPEDRAAFVPEKELAKALKDGRAEDERWHMRKDGSRFYASGVMQILRDGRTEGFVKIARDQTAKLEAEQSALEKEMLRRLVSTQEDERRRIARDIHDHFGQQITALRLKLDAIKKAAGDNAELSRQAADAEKTAAELDASVDFIAWELRPASLDDLGLRAALANFVNEWSNHTGIRAEFHANGLKRSRLDYEIETNLYRIAQEALNNILKHARAKNVSVILEKSGSKVSLIIEDDGIGFDPEDKVNRQKGLGLIGMLERAKICGGMLEIESAKGKGTTVFARMPAKK